MNRSWKLEVSLDRSDDGGAGFNLDLIRQDGGRSIRLLEGIRSLEELEDMVGELKSELSGELDKSLGHAESLAASLQEQGPEPAPERPEDIWASMESLTEEELTASFNSLPEEKRREVAEFVFTQVNMFKGQGPVFAAHFDNETGLLSV